MGVDNKERVDPEAMNIAAISMCGDDEVDFPSEKTAWKRFTVLADIFGVTCPSKQWFHQQYCKNKADVAQYGDTDELACTEA